MEIKKIDIKIKSIKNKKQLKINLEGVFKKVKKHINIWFNRIKSKKVKDVFSGLFSLIFKELSRLKIQLSGFPKVIKYYFRIWLLMSKNSFLMYLSQGKILLIFLIGKVIRFAFFFSFLYFLLIGSGKVLDYNRDQMIFFYLTFVTIDTTVQFFFREVYRFRPLVVSGELDLILVKPYKSLFRVLMGGADLIDLVTLPPLVVAALVFGARLSPSMGGVIGYLLLLINSFLIATSLHIISLSLAIITFEIDHTIMIYRDLTKLGAIPVDIYKQPLQSVLTYILPVGIIMTFPAKVLMGLMSPFMILISFLVGLVMIKLSLWFWEIALVKYQSASS